jgi:hypothetical protein
LPAPTSSSASLRLAARGRRRLLTTDAMRPPKRSVTSMTTRPGSIPERSTAARKALAQRSTCPRQLGVSQGHEGRAGCAHRLGARGVLDDGLRRYPRLSGRRSRPGGPRPAARAGHRGVASDRPEAAHPPVRTLTTRSDWGPNAAIWVLASGCVPGSTCGRQRLGGFAPGTDRGTATGQGAGRRSDLARAVSPRRCASTSNISAVSAIGTPVRCFSRRSKSATIARTALA